MSNMRPSTRCLLALLSCLLPLLGAHGRAEASMTPSAAVSDPVLLSESLLVDGTNATISSLNVPGAGELFLTLTDLQFPAPMSSLSLYLSNATVGLVDLSKPGTLTLTVNQPEQLFADVMWSTQSGQNSGLFNLNATFVPATPVPLPATGLLAGLAVLLAALAVHRRRLRPASTQLS